MEREVSASATQRFAAWDRQDAGVTFETPFLMSLSVWGTPHEGLL